MIRTVYSLVAVCIALSPVAKGQKATTPPARQAVQQKASPTKAPAPNYNGSWSGKTEQGRNISFEVTAGKITSISVRGIISGLGCTAEPDTRATVSVPILSRSFDVNVHGGPGSVSLAASGSFEAPARAKGSLVMTLHPIPGPPPGVPGYVPSCGGTAETTWIAVRGGSVTDADLVPTPSKPGVYDANSRGWSSVFGGAAVGQYFRAAASTVASISLRVARLNDNAPQAPLEVEVRDKSLQTIYARGRVAPTKPGREFRWTDVALDRVKPLEPAATYVLLMHSQKTDETAPWLLNTVYRDVYPDGREIGNNQDVFFKIVFDAKHTLLVGPVDDAPTLPFSSGTPSMGPVPGPLHLSAPRPIPTEAANDPLGPVPEGQVR